MKLLSSTALLALFLFIACSGTNAPIKKEKTYYVVIETPFGEMKLKLYNETPLHRDNFLKLTEEGFYDSLLFHRVIKDFMIQGGDPESKNAAPNKQLGGGGPGYMINAEIIKGLYHKKGALCAARQGDNVNPEKKSSGSQFYIVQGKKVSKEQLVQMTDQINFPIKRDLVFEYINNPEHSNIKNTIDSLQKARNRNAVNETYEHVAQLVDSAYLASDLFTYTEEQMNVYSSIGGTPHLDNNYTVFGEVIEGLNIIDSIAQVKTQRGDRPAEDIIINMKVVRK